jgi:D-tyrosyl-tRNA(Tyr) deacylase
MRIFEDEAGKMWSKSVKDLGLEVLLVSQFTLYAKMKGNKPDLHQAMPPSSSEQFYQDFVDSVVHSYDGAKVKSRSRLLKYMCEKKNPG